MASALLHASFAFHLIHDGPAAVKICVSSPLNVPQFTLIDHGTFRDARVVDDSRLPRDGWSLEAPGNEMHGPASSSHDVYVLAVSAIELITGHHTIVPCSTGAHRLAQYALLTQWG